MHPAFEQNVRVATQITGTPVALVSLVDSNHLHFITRARLDTPQVPREGSLWNYAIRQEVRDASEDPRFADSALVTGFPGIRFHAGVPPVTSQGHALGTLCVIDRQRRVLTQSQRMALFFCLAHVTVELLESRRREYRLQDALARR